MLLYYTHYQIDAEKILCLTYWRLHNKGFLGQQVFGPVVHYILPCSRSGGKESVEFKNQFSIFPYKLSLKRTETHHKVVSLA